MMRALLVGIAVVGALCVTAQATEVVLSDFNADAGLFKYSATFSGTSNVAATSTSARTTSAGEQYEGAGAMKLSLDIPASTAAGFGRERWVAGVSTAGSPAGQPTIQASAGAPGYIGFWYKVLASTGDFKLGINLDRPANSGTTMVGSVLVNAVRDGAWHKVEWRLGNLADWGAVSGIGGSAANLHAGDNLTIDSIYVMNMPLNANTTLLIDYVGWNNEGPIAPEPATLALVGLGLGGALIRRRR